MQMDTEKGAGVAGEIMSCCDRRRCNSWVADAQGEAMDHAMKIMDCAWAGLRAYGGRARSGGQLLFKNRLPQLIVEAAGRLRLDPGRTYHRAPPSISRVSCWPAGPMAIGLQLKGSIRGAVRALESKGIRFSGDVVNEGNAGPFIGFEDPDGNELYLAELNWSHAKKGEGEYQPAKA
jgi:hypothetical protein